MPKSSSDCKLHTSSSSLRLAENVQWLRAQLKWSTRALAEHSKLSLSTLYTVEHPDAATTRLKTLEKLAQGFGVHPLVLVSSVKQVRHASTRVSAIELVANNLRRIRREQGLTQETLSAAAEVSRHLIAKIEAESHENPTLELLDRLANALCVHTEAFFVDFPLPPGEHPGGL